MWLKVNQRGYRLGTTDTMWWGLDRSPEEAVDSNTGNLIKNRYRKLDPCHAILLIVMQFIQDTKVLQVTKITRKLFVFMYYWQTDILHRQDNVFNMIA